MRHVRDDTGQSMLSAHQASILDHLDDGEPTSLQTLARHMGVTASTMSLAVQRLVRGGFVLQNRDPQDARRTELRLTPSGLEVKRRQKVLEPALVAAMLARLKPDQRHDALRGLELLAGAASELIAGSEFRHLSGGAA